jgi:hypothetical protein
MLSPELLLESLSHRHEHANSLIRVVELGTRLVVANAVAIESATVT